MKKIFTLFVLMLWGGYTSYAQLTLWAVKGGASSLSEYGKAIHTDKQGNSYITGYYTGASVFGTDTLPVYGGTDVFVARLDKDGNFKWAKGIGGPGNDEGRAVFIDANGNINIGGVFKTKIKLSATDSIVAIGTQDAFFARYNSSGTLLNRVAIGETSKAYDLYDLVATSAGDYIGTGKVTQSSYADRIFLAKETTAGVVSWSNTTYNGWGNGLSLNTAGTSVYVIGSYNTGFNPTGSSLYNFGSSDIFYAPVTISSGAFGTARTMGSTGADYGKDIELDASDNIYVACTYANSMGIGQSLQNGSSITLNNSGYDAVVIKYNNIMQCYWYNKAATTGTDIARIRLDRFNNVFAHGAGYSGAWSHNGSGIGVVGYYNIKLHHSYGDILWRTGVNNVTIQGGIGVDSLGNVYTTTYFGGTRTFGTISLTAGSNDVVVTKQGSINILYPSLYAVTCVNGEYGDTLKVYAEPTYPLIAGNVYTVEADTNTSPTFTSPATIGTLSSTNPGFINCTMPKGIYTYPRIRVKTSSPLNAGEDIYLEAREKPWIHTSPTTINRCPMAFMTTLTMTSTIPNYGAFPQNTYTWSPMATLASVTYPDSYTTNAYSTATSSVTYTCTTVNSNGCKDTQTVRVNVYPVSNVFAGNDTTLCTGYPLLMASSTASAGTYAWTPTASFTNPASLHSTFKSTATGGTFTLTVTDANNCTNTDQILIYRQSSPTVDAGPVSYYTCPGSSINLISTASAGSTFSWQPAANLNVNNNDTVLASPLATTNYTVTATGTNGCQKTDSIKVYVNNITVNAGTDKTITCGQSTTLTTSLNGNNYPTPLTYNWLPVTGIATPTTASTTANPTATTNYIVTLTTGNGCSGKDTVKVIVTEPNYSTNFSASTQLLTSPPFIVQFSNTTPNPSNYTFTWIFGDGTTSQTNNTTVFHTYQYNGNYDVTLIATSNTTGCSDTLKQGGYIYCTGGTPCTLTSSITAPHGLSGCTGDTVLLSCNTGPNYTYQWSYNGSPIGGATASTYSALIAGNYSVLIDNTICTANSSVVHVSFSGLPAAPVITPSGSISLCGSGSVILQANSGYTAYAWSNGSTSQSTTVHSSGTYSVTVSNAAGCKASSSYTLNASALATPDVCLVGVDSTTGKNLVVWNKPSSSQIDSFIIYREGTVTSQFNKIASQAYSVFSTYIDNNSNPQQQAYRYKIAVLDTCGVLTPLSTYHKTMHLTINQGAGSTWNLIWNYYEGFAVSSYNIYRGTTTTNMTLLTTVSGSNNSYTDLTPPMGNVYYQVEVLGSNCAPTLFHDPKGTYSINSVNFNSSKSNIVTDAIWNVNVTGIHQQNLELLVMPNPNNGVFQVALSGDGLNNTAVMMEVFDEWGNRVYAKAAFSNGSLLKETVQLNELANGVYLIQFTTGKIKKHQRISIVK